jgi:hypothetical protein
MAAAPRRIDVHHHILPAEVFLAQMRGAFSLALRHGYITRYGDNSSADPLEHLHDRGVVWAPEIP